MANKISDETIEYVGILAKLELSGQEKEDAKAGALFLFFLEHMDRDNALIVSQECMSEILGWSIPTIKRKLQVLKEKNFVQYGLQVLEILTGHQKKGLVYQNKNKNLQKYQKM